ncbi:NAD(P)/FAD-dependent oxidoreductase [Dactylosporangium sucinum]|uniref:Oxidoreductase n=1 Tax=Dactylosporangium sucinum TaxID=1424081 RepID=A0A917WHJ3_9ACTN|nr:FAD-binding oxidoreductase [Dactylosporangium sucinum]GGM04598.1 oxidoreductase [Dactylosporangium sucinum]
MLDVPRGTDVVVIGAGIVGAACAYAASRAGLRVAVLDRGPVIGGTTGAGEGNILVSDKGPGPELDLALLSSTLWRQFGAEHGDTVEYESKGGLVVAADEADMQALRRFADAQRAVGVQTQVVAPDDLAELEPHLAPGLAGGVQYPQDAQVQPMLAAALLLRLARERGATVHPDTPAIALRRGRHGRVTSVGTPGGVIPAQFVVNAAGVWAGHVAALAGVRMPVLPRRGCILVSQPLPVIVRHKVYGAGYTSDVLSDAADLQISPVIEGTRAGTVLIGASRERVGFDRAMPVPVLARLAALAIGLFPVLADSSVIRAYLGFRPYLPDHLPALGAHPRVPGLLHACGHEGAGIGLALASGHLIGQLLTGAEPALDLRPFRPDRFGDPADDPRPGALTEEAT